MRLAILLNGGWRGVSWNIAQYNLNLFKKYNPDYFIHTWDSYNGKRIAQTINDTPVVDTSDVKYNIEDLQKKIKDLYSPVYLQIDSSHKMDAVFNVETNGCDTCGWAGWWSAWEANNLKRMYEQRVEFKYDVVIRLRPDVLFTKNQEKNVHNKIQYILNNKNVIFTHYVNDNSRILTHNIFPVIDYYHISTSNIIDWLHDWVYLKTYNKNQSLRDHILKKLDTIQFNPQLNEVENITPSLCTLQKLHATPLLLRELFADEEIIDYVYNNYDNELSIIKDIYVFLTQQDVDVKLNSMEYYKNILPTDNLLIKNKHHGTPTYFFNNESQFYTKCKIKQLLQENSYD